MPDHRLLVTESGFQDAVIQFARTIGWTVAHFRPARTNHGHRTAVQADGAGFPDLVLVRERVIFAELKAEGGRLSRQQDGWLQALGEAGAEVYEWRPSQWPTIEAVLRHKRAEVQP